MLDFQGNLDMNKQDTNKGLRIKLHYYKEDDNYNACSVCVEGKDIPIQRVKFLENDEKNSYGKVAVLSLNNSDELKDINLSVIDNGRKLKNIRLDSIRHLEKNGVIEVYVDSEGKVQPKKKKVLVNIFFMKEDCDFAGWNDLHMWINKNKGFNVKFEKGSDCMLARVEVEVECLDVMGFLIRKNGDEWTEKEWEERYINLRQHEKNGVVNMYVVYGKKEIYLKPPVIINFHYYRYSGNFDIKNNNFDGWDIWSWVQFKVKGCGKGFPIKFYKFDDYGAVATYVCSNLDDIEKLGFLIRKNGEKWESIDMEKDRYIEADQVKKILDSRGDSRNRTIDCYLGEGILEYWYSKEEAKALDKRIVSAKYKCPEEGRDIKSFYVELNNWLDIKGVTDDTKNGIGFKLISESGEEIPIEDVQGTGEIRDDNKKARLFRINLKNGIMPIDKTYTVALKNFGQSPVSIKTLYNHKEFKKKCLYEFGMKYTERKLTENYTEKSAEFKVLALNASELELCLYDNAVGGEPKIYKLEDANHGMWYSKIIGEDLKGKFYTYRAKVGDEIIEFIDPYAKVRVENRERGVIVDPKEESRQEFNLVPKVNEKVLCTAAELGVYYTKEYSEFRIWAPSDDGLQLCLYDNDIGGEPKTYEMKKSYGGTWYVKIDGDLKGKFYTYKAKLGTQVIESIDPYAKAAGVNGERGAIIDLKDTNPEGWDETPKPKFDKNLLPIIHEVNIRDYTIDKSSGVEEKYRGKYKGLTIKGTKTKDGISTCLDHILDMGYTHVQLMPIADFGSVDESIKDAVGSYWGYDTVHWLVPEGSYSTNPHDPIARIKELKEVIQTFHENGVGVIIDVVFNHTYRTQFSPFNVFAPDYFYRIKNNGEYSKATGCSNEIASEKEMVRKYIVDAIKYWVKEFKVDGFRFDVMYLLDIDTMNAIRKSIDEINPAVKMINAKDASKVWVYGEGWKPPIEPIISREKLAIKDYADRLPGIGFFDSCFAGAIKGDFDNQEAGYATQNKDCRDEIKACIEADKHRPEQLVNYVGVHDNLTWWDKICRSFNNVNEKLKLHEIRKNIYKFGYSIIFTRPGLTLVPEGDEMLRTKYGKKNSYDAGDEINAVKWGEKKKHQKIVDYIKGLIKMKKAYSVFSGNGEIELLNELNDDHLVGYSLKNDEEKAVVIHNGGWEKKEVTIPERLGKDWAIIVNNEKAGAEEIMEVEEKKGEEEQNKEVLKVKNNRVVVLAHSSKVLIDKKTLQRYRERKRKSIKVHDKEFLGNSVVGDNCKMRVEMIQQENVLQREFQLSI